VWAADTRPLAGRLAVDADMPEIGVPPTFEEPRIPAPVLDPPPKKGTDEAKPAASEASPEPAVPEPDSSEPKLSEPKSSKPGPEESGSKESGSAESDAKESDAPAASEPQPSAS
jgi:hypothetical protein